MAIHTQWDNEQHTIIRREISGEWSWRDLFVYDEQLLAMLNEVSHSVDVINDVGNQTGMPNNFGTLMQDAGQAPTFIHQNCGMQVVVGSTSLRHVLGELQHVIARSLVERTKLAATLDKAYAVLEKNRRFMHFQSAS